jgi:hypothetical protein
MTNHERLDILFDLVNNTELTADQIDLEVEKRLDLLVKEIGKKSEKKAESALLELNIIDEIRRCEWGDEADTKHRDLTVKLNPEQFENTFSRRPSVKTVYVQVKSSFFHAQRFLKLYGKNRQEVASNLAQDRLVVIDAGRRSSFSRIKRVFLNSVTNIDQYWRKKVN